MTDEPRSTDHDQTVHRGHERCNDPVGSDQEPPLQREVSHDVYDDNPDVGGVRPTALLSPNPVDLFGDAGPDPVPQGKRPRNRRKFPPIPSFRRAGAGDVGGRQGSDNQRRKNGPQGTADQQQSGLGIDRAPTWNDRARCGDNRRAGARLKGAGRLHDAAIYFSGFATPTEVVESTLQSFLGYLGHDLTPAEAEACADEICLCLETSGWCLSDLLNGDVIAVPAAAVESVFHVFDCCDGSCPHSTVKPNRSLFARMVCRMLRIQP